MSEHALVIRLARKFDIDEEDAALLVEAGFDTPGKIKAAEDGDIVAVVGRSALKQIRG